VAAPKLASDENSSAFRKRGIRPPERALARAGDLLAELLFLAGDFFARVITTCELRPGRIGDRHGQEL
jgi:hypothetical protein